jgi:4-amino-4-deoxy-L-arabinose transferase-like glycosyltransferase
MPTKSPAVRVLGVLRYCWPELLLAALAGAVFLGCLGSVDLWGKREQRTSAEAIDTIDHNHWLVAQIQGRPRLEKPPLPRWSIAALLMLTGRRDEWIVRLPSAMSALAIVALIYSLGRRMGGRAVGLASALILCSLGFFVGEMRQSSNDGPLVLFTTLALYAAWRRLHDANEAPLPEERRHWLARGWELPGGRRWQLVFHAALGLGFLTKGPVILLLVAVTVIPYLAFSRRLRWGIRRLADGWGLLLFAALALSWPVAVLLEDPSALRVWSLEISEKTGLSQILEHRHHSLLMGQWPAMVLPWTLIALVAVVLPFFRTTLSSSRDGAGTSGARSSGSSFLWFAWWWAVGNLMVFCLWAVAKPNYYLPCLPGMALLIGSTWVHLAHAGRGWGRAALLARGILQTQWVLLFVGAVVAPLVVRDWLPVALWPCSVVIALALAAAVVVSVYTWRRGADALSLAPVTAACVFGVLIAYGMIAPAENPARGHRALAQRLPQLLPPGVRTLMFFNEIDEGLWFYSSGLELTPVPGSHPRYNTAYDLAQSYLTERLPYETISDLEAKRQAREKQTLIKWLDHNRAGTSYLLIRSHLYDLFADDLAGRVTPLFRETGMKRNELILLEVAGNRPPAGTAASQVPTRR